MTIPALTQDQWRYLGKLIWKHIDGVAENVNDLVGTINRDPLAAVRVVATPDWERAVAVLHSLQELVVCLESGSAHLTIDQVMAHLRELVRTDVSVLPCSNVPGTTG